VSFQRKRKGLPAKVWKTAIQRDNRNNAHVVPVPANPHQVRAWIFPQRSSKAEVPGQQQINVIRIGVDANLADVELWSRVEFMGREWDVVAPPAYHHGHGRHTRHWSIDLRQRPLLEEPGDG
jgi:hypothetical protein